MDFIRENEKHLYDVIPIIDHTLRNCKKLIICGNGWSAADAQHISAEFTRRYNLQKKSLPAIY